MSTYDFNNKKDCQAFIGLILDNYCPKQLEGIDATVLSDAVRSCKENGFKLTGNRIYNKCCTIAVDNLICRLKDINVYELDLFETLASSEYSIVENFLYKAEDKVSEALGWYCNGSEDSSIFFDDSNLTNEDLFAIQKINEITLCFTDFQEEIGYVNGLDELLECEVKLEINEPDICD